MDEQRTIHILTERVDDEPKAKFIPYGIRTEGLHYALSYVLGVIAGDASLRRKVSKLSPKALEMFKKRGHKYDKQIAWVVKLSATDREFVYMFAYLLEKVIRRPDLRRDVKKYIKVLRDKRTKNYKVKYLYSRGITNLCRWINSTPKERIRELILENPEWFLRGLYDSEGTVIKNNLKRGKLGVYISIFNTDYEIIKLASDCLKKLGIEHKIYVVRPTGSKVKLPNGKIYETKKPLYAIAVIKKKDVFEFAHRVGSYIARKNPLLYLDCECPICMMLKGEYQKILKWAKSG